MRENMYMKLSLKTDVGSFLSFYFLMTINKLNFHLKWRYPFIKKNNKINISKKLYDVFI